MQHFWTIILYPSVAIGAELKISPHANIRHMPCIQTDALEELESDQHVIRIRGTFIRQQNIKDCTAHCEDTSVQLNMQKLSFTRFPVWIRDVRYPIQITH